ncbi:thiamine pyrophosphate-binding protein [Butyricicoccus faecihominis]|uniref:thiamine pyrophosphate-binding protein n=1 Tax=Butyricicoccus faecihominis TaxID=1712515 RepID=UPI002479F248|nr:thiamine pyrophosphate-binding protein [Butyricicoccus faecihominis]MCQ5128032.1 thiamine pyrophosphate-binding protein [Butyricicoccus faecihominis]
MKLSDYIVEFLIAQGVTDIFGYPGGMVTHFMDSLDRYRDKISAHVNYHEQASAFCACGYAQAGGPFGVAYATSGPGATNLITGIANAYFDSIPTLFITGQVNTYEARGKMPLRQKGFQETDIVAIVTPVTKYAVRIDDPNQIRYVLEKAVYLCSSGRPGPVLLDVPMDIFRADIDIPVIKKFCQPESEKPDYTFIAEEMLGLLKNAKRPVILAGGGIVTSGCASEFRQIAHLLNVPVVTSMIGCGILATDDLLNYGFIGAYGNRSANFIICNSDLIISLGSRLDCRQTGNDLTKFAPDTVIYRIDIDANEFSNRISNKEIQVTADLRDLLPAILKRTQLGVYPTWITKCNRIKKLLGNLDQSKPTEMIAQLGSCLPNDAVITTDVGQNQVWTAQCLMHSEQQMVLFSGGHGAMGYALPAAIGAYFSQRRATICIVGDGGLQMNIQELEFVARESIPLKIILINNNSLGMIRHFQEMYFDSNFMQTKAEKGYLTPNFEAIAKAYGLRYGHCETALGIEQYKPMLMDQQTLFLEVQLDDTTYVLPKLSMGKPIYDQDPLMSRNLLQTLIDICYD